MLLPEEISYLPDLVNELGRSEHGLVMVMGKGGVGKGRLARLIEYDPGYCDMILQRFETVTGTPAILARTGQSFEDIAAARISHRPDQGKTSTVQPAEAAP